MPEARACLDPGISLSLKRQCALLGISRSSYYYRSREGKSRSADIPVMHAIDELHTACPFYGNRRIVHGLWAKGYSVGIDRVRRLRHEMGIEAIYPKKSLSRPSPGHSVYPYLLRGVSSQYPDHIWSTDITYIRMQRGFVYLVAIMDWYSRYVLSWELSTGLEASFCLLALEKSLKGGKPLIFNSDQGSQFTSVPFTEKLLSCGVQVSMDGRGRVYDNIFIERLWRSVKYEEVYLKSYETVREAYEQLKRYFEFYNAVRPHQSLNNRTPESVYRERMIS